MGLVNFSTSGWAAGYEAGYKQGYEDGYRDGYEDGYAKGLLKGKNNTKQIQLTLSTGYYNINTTLTLTYDPTRPDSKGTRTHNSWNTISGWHVEGTNFSSNSDAKSYDIQRIKSVTLDDTVDPDAPENKFDDVEATEENTETTGTE